jgi:hypothetical protein
MRRLSRTGKVLLGIFSFVFLCNCAPDDFTYSIMADRKEFIQDYKLNNKIDVLFVVDNSYSTHDDQQNLINNFEAFIEQFITLGYDFHIGVTTTDISPFEDDCYYSPGGVTPDEWNREGRLIGDPYFITPFTPNIIDEFMENAAVGENGCGKESGHQAAYLALTDPRKSDENAGFLRDDAFTALVFLSDEYDYTFNSNNPYPTAFETVEEYVEFFENLKPNSPYQEDKLSISAIVWTEEDSGKCKPTDQFNNTQGIEIRSPI